MFGVANVVIPAGSELIGMWGGEWDMQSEQCSVRLYYSRLIRHHFRWIAPHFDIYPFRGYRWRRQYCAISRRDDYQSAGTATGDQRRKDCTSREGRDRTRAVAPLPAFVDGLRSESSTKMYPLYLLTDKSTTGIYPSRTRTLRRYSNQKESFCARRRILDKTSRIH